LLIIKDEEEFKKKFENEDELETKQFTKKYFSDSKNLCVLVCFFFLILLVFMKGYFFFILADKINILNPRINNYLLILSTLFGFFIFVLFLHSANRKVITKLISFGIFACSLIPFLASFFVDPHPIEYIGLIMSCIKLSSPNP
jgi:hypothetical protein